MVTISLNSVIGQRKLEKLKAGFQPDRITSAIGGRLMSYVGESFDTRGRGQWAALSQLTLLLRQRGGDVPLQDTGANYKPSFVQETDGETYVEVGTNIKTDTGISLGKIHEFGAGPYTVRVRRAKVLAAKTRAGQWLHFGKEVEITIPARPVLPTKEVGEHLVREAVDAMLQKLADGVNRGGD